MKSKVASFFRVLAALAIGASLVPALVSPAPAVAGNQAWTDFSDPTRLNLGAIRSISFAKDGLTGFATTTVATGGSSTSNVIKTTNGGVSWSAVGLFSEANANRPTGLAAAPALGTATRLIVKVSPNYATDATVFVAFGHLTGPVNQIFWSKDGGATFTQIGSDLTVVAGTVITDMDVSDNFNGTTFAKNTVAVVTANAADNTQGALWRLRGSISSPSWTAWAVVGDYYAIKYMIGSSDEALVIASSDNDAADNAIWEYRINFEETTVALTLDGYSATVGSVTPSRTGFILQLGGAATAVTAPAVETSVLAAISLPDNWAQGTASDREVIAIDLDAVAGGAGAGGAARGALGATVTVATGVVTVAGVAAEGLIARRTATGAGSTISIQGTAEGAPENGYTSASMTGNSTTGFVLSGTHDGGVLRSTNGGQSWSTVARGITDEIDGTAGNTTTAVVSSKGWIGNGGNRGGVFYTTTKGSSWKDGGAYSDDLDDEYLDIARTSDGTWFLVAQDNATANESLFKATSTLAFYRVSRQPNMQIVRASPAFATDQTVYVGVNAGVGATTGQLLKSTDGGEHFATTTTDPDQVGTTDKALALSTLVVLDKDTVVAGLASGLVALSTNGGETWQHSTSNPAVAFADFTLSPDGTKIMGITATRIVYISTNKGITWSQQGATVGAAGTGNGIAFDPAYATNSYIYAAISGTTSAVWRLKSSTATTTTAWDAIGADINPAGVGVNSMQVAAQNDGYRLGFDANGNLWVASFDDADNDNAYDAAEASFVASTFDPKEAVVTWRTVPTAITDGAFGGGVGAGAFASYRQMIIYGTPPTILAISEEAANNDMNALTDTSAAPVALSPADKTSGVPRATALQWSSVPDATTYDARLGLTTDPIGTGVGAYNATDQTGVETTNQYGGDGMIVGGKFYWKVREQAPLTSRWSPVWSFTVGEAGVAGVEPNPTPAAGLTAFAGSYETAWRFDNATQSWKVYDPAAPAAVNTLTNLVKDSPFVLVAKNAGAFTYGSKTYTVVKGVNFLSWLGN